MYYIAIISTICKAKIQKQWKTTKTEHKFDYIPEENCFLNVTISII